MESNRALQSLLEQLEPSSLEAINPELFGDMCQYCLPFANLKKRFGLLSRGIKNVLTKVKRLSELQITRPVKQGGCLSQTTLQFCHSYYNTVSPILQGY